MSAYLTLMTPMMDKSSLLAALADQGFGPSKVEIHETAVPLVGYEGDRRQQSANLVVRRAHIRSASNDLGFLRTSTGYQLIVSDYDSPSFGQSWLSRLNDRYQVHWDAKQARLAEEERRRVEEERRRLVEAQRQEVCERAKKMGYRVQESRQGEKVRLVLLKRVY